MTSRPRIRHGAVFGSATDGDGRVDHAARRELVGRLGVPEAWAWMRQVHGTVVVEATSPGGQGDADALFTTVPQLALVAGTADCLPVILEGDLGVGIAHAGWRGAAGGVVTALRSAMEEAGIGVIRASIGPCIGPCCFEVGPEVLDRFPRHATTTTWGTPSVDLPGAVASELEDLEVRHSGVCTRTDERYHSHRRNATPHRQVSATWLRA